MKLKNLTKSLSVIFILLAMLFSCQPVTENNDSNNTTQDGGNNNGGSNNDGNNSGNENGSENNGGNSNTEKPAEKITITFDLNGIDETLPTTVIETTSNKSVYLPVLTNTKFLHWNTSPDGSGQSYNGTGTFTESVTLYAILLAENAHKITYVLDGGVNNSANPFSFTENEDIVLKEPTKDGYYFLGWYEDNNNMYIDSLKAWNAGEKSSNVTLYAKWVKSYKITYVLNGGVNSSYNPSFFTENDDRVYLGKPTKDGYFFCGWYETADFTGSKIIDRVAVKKTDVIFYAKWIKEEELIPGTYTAGTGVYELRAPKSKIYSPWEGGFCVLLLKEDQLTKLETTKEGKIQFNPQAVGTFDMPTAQLGGGNLLFPKYASAEGNAEITYYDEKVLNSAWATLDKDFFTFYVDMSKILIDDTAVEVKVFANNNELMGDDWLGFGDNLDLTDYKPYVVALFDGTSDIVDGETTYAKYLGQCSWGAGIWEMTTSTATKPTSFDKFLDKEPLSITSYPDKASYFVGEELDLTGLGISAYNSDGSTSNVEVTLDMVSGFDSSIAGVQTLTITYGDCTITFDVEVIEQ